MDDQLRKEMINLAEDLISTATNCLKETSQFQETLRNTNFSKQHLIGFLPPFSYAGGDSADLNQNKRTASSLHTRLTQKEYMSLLIKNATEENSKLRNSNIRLKQESKIQDQKIRELNRKVMLQEKLAQKDETQRKIINELKKSIDSKSEEIRFLKKNLENIQLLLSKEQKKINSMEQNFKKNSAELKINKEVQSKLELILSQIDQILNVQERTKSRSNLNSDYIRKIQEVLNRLKIVNTKLLRHNSIGVPIKKATTNHPSVQTENMVKNRKFDKKVQVCGSDKQSHVILLNTKDKMDCARFENQKRNTFTLARTYGHRRSKSI